MYIGGEPYAGEELPEDAEWRTVVGVVDEIVQEDLTDPSRTGAFYLPYRQVDARFARLVVKTKARPLDVAPAVRDRIAGLDPEMVLWWVTTLEQTVVDSLIAFRVPVQLLLIFAGVALLLAAVGVYGVLAQSVAQRTREIGIRMALGSTLRQIYRWVFSSMFVFVATGLALGLAGALSVTHLMAAQLFQVRPAEPAVFFTVGLAIGVVAIAAAAMPARRATRINPAEVLTSE